MVDAARLSVVGLVEVVRHIPRVYREFRRIMAAARQERPDLAILTDSPDFHLRLAPRLKRLGIPVVYLVAPQVWAWRKRRIGGIRCNTDRLLCIFPFEEDFFRKEGISAHYIGHPLARLVKPASSREAFCSRHAIQRDRPLVCLLPGSRAGEALRHVDALLDAAARLGQAGAVGFVLALPAGFWPDGVRILSQRVGRLPIKVVEGETWDAIAYSEVALAASGTVTIEAALLGTPMVTFYRLSGLSWLLGKSLVDVPFYSMVNLVAGRRVVPELIQNEMTGERLAAETSRLLEDAEARQRMRQDLSEVAAKLAGAADPMERAARIVAELLGMDQGVVHVA